jgi:recombination protein RecR
MNSKYPEALQALITYLRKFPGVGTRTAERFAFELLKWKSSDLQELGSLLSELQIKVLTCQTCGCLTGEGPCRFCNQTTRDGASLCILSTPRDAYAIEETRSFRGLYHVIEHLLSPLDGRHAAAIRIDRIEERIRKHQVKEVILAFDSTLEGDATALYLKQQLSQFPISISRLAFGLPVGSNLEYIDSGTLAKALSGRQSI